MLTESQQQAFTSHKDWFAALLRHCDSKTVAARKIPETLQLRYPEVWERITDSKTSARILAIGVGNGILEVPLIKGMVGERGVAEGLEVYCMDPSAELRQEFMQSVYNVSLARVIKDYALATFEAPSYTPPHDVDFALASHCWYYIPKGRGKTAEANPMVKFLNTVRAGGVAHIELQSNRSDNFTVRSKLTPLIHTGQTEKCGEDVEKELEELGIKYESEIADVRTDVREIFPSGSFAPSKEGELLLSFMLRADWNQQSLEIQEEMRNVLTEIVGKNAKPTMYFRERYIWIPVK